MVQKCKNKNSVEMSTLIAVSDTGTRENIYAQKFLFKNRGLYQASCLNNFTANIIKFKD